jgi:hypothetical protein
MTQTGTIEDRAPCVFKLEDAGKDIDEVDTRTDEDVCGSAECGTVNDNFDVPRDCGSCTTASEAVCDTTNDICVQCVINEDCFDVQHGPTPEYTYGADGACDSTNGCYSAPECTGDFDCAGSTVTTCNLSTGRCSE